MKFHFTTPNSPLIHLPGQLLNHAGLETYVYSGTLEDAYMCKIRAPVHVLRQLANDTKYPLKLKPTALKLVAESGSKGIKPFSIASTPSEVSKTDPGVYEFHFHEVSICNNEYAINGVGFASFIPSFILANAKLLLFCCAQYILPDKRKTHEEPTVLHFGGRKEWFGR